MTKRCPFCAEEIQAAAIKCKHCGTLLDGSVPTPPTVKPRVPPPPPHSPERVAVDRRVWRGRLASVAAVLFTMVALAAGGFVLFRQRAERQNLDGAIHAAQDGRCGDADGLAAKLLDARDREVAARERLKCDIAALDQAVRAGDCLDGSTRLAALAEEYKVPLQTLVAAIAKPLGRCLADRAEGLASQGRCDEARAIVNGAHDLLDPTLLASFADVEPICQAVVRRGEIKALAATLLRAPSGPASGAILVAAPADFDKLFEDLHIDPSGDLAAEEGRRQAATRTAYLAAVDRAYERYDSGSQTLVLDAYQYLIGQTFFHFSLKEEDLGAALYPEAASRGLIGDATHLAQLKLAPDAARELSFALDSGRDKLLVAFQPSKIDESTPAASKTIAIGTLLGVWIADLGNGTLTPLTIGPPPGSGGGGGEADLNPFAP